MQARIKNLIQRKGVFYARIKIGGRDIKRSLGTSDRKQAVTRLKAFLTALDQEVELVERQVGQVEQAERKKVVPLRTSHGLSPASTFAEVSEVFCNRVVDTIVKPSTAARYRTSLNMALQFFGEWSISDIAEEDFFDYIEWRRETHEVTNNTLQRDLTAISQVFRFAVSRKLVRLNTALLFDRYYLRGPVEVYPLPTPEDIEELVNRCATVQMKSLVRFLTITGMRLTEATTLEWSQVNFDRREITLIRTKTSQPRVLRFDTPAGTGGTLEALLLDLKQQSRSRFVFSTHPSLPVANASSRLAQFRRGTKTQRKLEFRTHDLRHYMAVNWLRSGGALYDLSKYLGHASVKTTEIYLRWLAV